MYKIYTKIQNVYGKHLDIKIYKIIKNGNRLCKNVKHAYKKFLMYMKNIESVQTINER